MRAAGAGATCLAVGDRVADALEAATGRPPARRTDVHETLVALVTEGRRPVVVGSDALRSRPRAALRALRRAAHPEPVVVLGDARGETDPRVDRAARAQGVPRAASAEEALAMLGRGSLGRVAPRPSPRPPVGGPEIAFVDGCVRRLGCVADLARFVLRSFVAETGAGRATLLLMEPDRGRMAVVEGVGFDPALLDRARVAVGSGPAGRAAACGRALVGRGRLGGPRDYRGRSYVLLPLGRGPECEGVAALTDLPGDAVPADAALRGLVRMARRAGRSLAAARRLERAEALSTTDALTGLPNRRAFERALHREVERARRAGTPLAVGLLDVDHFKQVNDRHGHPAGDRVLAEVGRRLSSAFRETDLVCRWGGEEFAVLLAGLSQGTAPEALAVLERARHAVGGRPVALGAGLPEADVRLSGGVAVFPADAADEAGLLRRADEALYEAKRAGRDRVLCA